MGNCCSRAGIGSAGSPKELLDSQRNGFEQATSPDYVAKKVCQEIVAGRAALPDSSSSTTGQADLTSSNEDFKDAACRNVRKVHASKVQDGCDSNHASTGLLSCMPILQKLARKSPPTVERPTGNNSSRGAPKSPGALRSRLISLQSSGSLIPAGLAQHSPGDEPFNEPSQDILILESAAETPHIPHSSSGSCAPSLKPSYGPKGGAEDAASNSSTAGEPGLTLMVSSHSNSSHHGSPRSPVDNSSSRCSSRASSESGHTAFASIPSSLFNSGSLTPDSMLSALSTTSSCISSSSSNGNHSSNAKARPVSSTAAAVGITYTDEGAAGPVVTAAAAGAQQLMQQSTAQQHQATRQGPHPEMPQQQLDAAANNVGTAHTAAAPAAAGAQAATLQQDRLAAPAAAAAAAPSLAAEADATSQQSPSSSDSSSCAAFGPQQVGNTCTCCR